MKKYFKPTTESVVLQGLRYLMTVPPSQKGLLPSGDNKEPEVSTPGPF